MYIKPHNEDPLERAITDLLNRKRITFTRPERDSADPSNLDFYLPKYDVSIEVKAWHCNRLHTQIETSGQDGKIIVLIGERAVSAFIDLMDRKGME